MCYYMSVFSVIPNFLIFFFNIKPDMTDDQISAKGL